MHPPPTLAAGSAVRQGAVISRVRCLSRGRELNGSPEPVCPSSLPPKRTAGWDGTAATPHVGRGPVVRGRRRRV
jgi:hypothetical protein